jgi:hypothetical protein
LVKFLLSNIRPEKLYLCNLYKSTRKPSLATFGMLLKENKVPRYDPCSLSRKSPLRWYPV